MAKKGKPVVVWEIVQRCNFCEGEMKRCDPANQFCSRKNCLAMRLRQADERVVLAHGKRIGNKRVGHYIEAEFDKTGNRYDGKKN